VSHSASLNKFIASSLHPPPQSALSSSQSPSQTMIFSVLLRRRYRNLTICHVDALPARNLDPSVAER
jgi:hypothetical protein